MKVGMDSRFPLTLFELEAVSTAEHFLLRPTLKEEKKQLNSAGNICFL